MKLSDNALYLLKQRYLRKNESNDIIETPEEMFRRVARTIASIETLYGKDQEEVKNLEEQFYNIMTSLKFLPNSPCLMNAGTDLGILSACFVIGLEDSIDSIMNVAKYISVIHKGGGGTGIDLTPLRPKGDIVRSSGGVASGPVSFLKIYNSITEVIKQGGRRRGANMGVLHYFHPDILDFITCKEKEGNFANFNLSVGTDDKFMEAVEKDEEIDLINPRNNKTVKSIRARSIWNLMLIMAWRNGEPGVLFFDTINKYNPILNTKMTAVNPCAEQPLEAFESCNLGSINLSKFIRDGKIQWKELEETVRLATRFLDNVIDANKYPFKIIEEQTKKNRKIGLGIMGWHELLIRKGIRYDSEEALQLARDIMKFITSTAEDESSNIAKEKGNFPNKENSIWKSKKYMRNATVTTIAPTGSISIIANTSQGIEPLFALTYTRNVKDSLGRNLVEYNPFVASILKEYNVRKVHNLPEDIRSLLVTANEISPEWHVRMQAAFQKYTHNAVSKTVNLPNSATIYDIEDIFLLAYKLKCKGITVYRNGSRERQLLTKCDTEQCFL